MTNDQELLYRPQIAKLLGITDKQAERIVWSESFPAAAYAWEDGRPALAAWRRGEVEAWIAKREKLVT